MSLRDQIFGGIVSIIALIILFYWLYIMYFIEDILTTLQWQGIKLLATVIIIVVMLIFVWIGYTIATTPSIEEIEAKVRKKRKP